VGPRNDIWRCLPSNDEPGKSWELLLREAPWTTRWGHCSVALHGGAVLVLGGMDGGGELLGDVWRSDDEGSNWQRLGEPPWPPRVGHRLVALGCGSGSALLAGGLGAEGRRGSGAGHGVALGDVWRTDSGGERWELACRAAPWAARSWFGLVALPSGALLMAGGLASDGSLLNDVWHSLDNGRSWTLVLLTAPWMARRGHGLVVLASGELLLMGGIGCEGTVNDVWQSLDQGETWQQAAAAAAWTPRADFGLVALPCGGALLLGGQERGSGGCCADAWWGVSHTYAGADADRSPVVLEEIHGTEGAVPPTTDPPSLPFSQLFGDFARLSPTLPPRVPDCPSSPPAASLGRERTPRLGDGDGSNREGGGGGGDDLAGGSTGDTAPAASTAAVELAADKRPTFLGSSSATLPRRRKQCLGGLFCGRRHTA